MPSFPRLCLIAAVFPLACSVDLDPGDVVITCTSAAQCPSGFSCDLDLGRCIEGATNRPVEPTVSLEQVKPADGVRFVDIVQVTFIADDRNIPHGDVIGVAFEFTVGDSEQWIPATPADAPITGLADRATRAVFRWNALADAQSGLAGLAVDAAGFVALRDDVRVRAKATDSTGLSSSFAVSETFAIGNTLAIADVSPFAEPSYAGLLAIQMTLTDAAADRVDLEVEFQTSDNMTWRRADIDSALVTDAPTTTTGNTYLVAWRTSTPADADTTVPQGVGKVWAEGVAIRARAVDHPEGSTSYPGPWSTVRTIQSVRNQTPPEISGLEVLRPNGMSGSGRFAVAYVLADAEGDRVDLRAEVSSDGGTWITIPEYPTPVSEGFLDLATVPRSTTSDGVRHVLMLDPAGIGLRGQVRRVRLTATDGFPTAQPLTTSAEANAGTLGTAPFSQSLLADLAGGFAFDIVSGDFVGSTALDIAVAMDASVYIYQGDGAGNFTYSLQKSVGTYAYAVRAGRFDADSKSDIVVLNSGGATMSVLLSSTSFTPASYTVGTTPHGVAVADIDNDGRDDIAVASAGSKDVRIFRGNGSGGFVLGVTMAMGASAHGIAIADIDGDGLRDLAVAAGDDLSVLYGTGTSSVVASPQTYVSGGTSAMQVAIADFDLDGAPDVVLGMLGENSAAAFANRGARDLELAQTLLLDVLTDAAPAIGTSDLNGDGRPELVMMGGSDVYIADGASVLDSFVAPTRYDASVDPSGVAIADFNGDGLYDVLVACAEPDGEDQLIKLLSRGTPGGGSGVGATTSAPTIAYPTSVALGDVDGDGVEDILVADRPASGTPLAQVAVVHVGAIAGAASGTLENYPPLIVDGDLFALKAADMNDDGLVDVVSTHGPSSGAGTLVVDLMNADGTLTTVASFTTGSAPGSVVIDDFNEDGVPDIVVGNRLSQSAMVVLGSTSAGAWSGTTTTYSLGLSPQDIIVGDFDGDGHRDFIGVAAAAIATRRGNGAGGFSAPANASVTGNLLYGAAADINDDGCDDVMVGAVGSYKLFLGSTSAGTYVDTAIAGSCSQQTRISRADRDGDGVFDFVGGYASGTSGCVFTATRGTVLGTGVLTASAMALTGTLVGSVSSDLNRDGLDDLVTVVMSPDQVAVDWLRDVTAGARRGVGIDASVLPVSARWSQSNTSTLGRTITTSEAVRLGALGLLKGYAPRYLVPLTAAERVVGDVELQRVEASRVSVGESTGDRLRIAAKLGALDPSDASGQQRIGLDLGATPPRGVTFDLPILSGRTASASGTIRVFIGSPDWRRASETPDDPLQKSSGSTDYLPRLPNGDGSFRDLIDERTLWQELARDTDSDFATGTGSRFYVDTKNAVVHVITDRLGLVQAYVDTHP